MATTTPTTETTRTGESKKVRPVTKLVVRVQLLSLLYLAAGLVFGFAGWETTRVLGIAFLFGVIVVLVDNELHLKPEQRRTSPTSAEAGRVEKLTPVTNLAIGAELIMAGFLLLSLVLGATAWEAVLVLATSGVLGALVILVDNNLFLKLRPRGDSPAGGESRD